MHIKRSEIISTLCTSTCKWTSGPHNLGSMIIPSLLPNYYWVHIRRQVNFHHFHRCSHILWPVLWPVQPVSFVLSSHASSSHHQLPSGINFRVSPYDQPSQSIVHLDKRRLIFLPMSSMELSCHFGWNLSPIALTRACWPCTFTKLSMISDHTCLATPIMLN